MLVEKGNNSKTWWTDWFFISENTKIGGENLCFHILSVFWQDSAQLSAENWLFPNLKPISTPKVGQEELIWSAQLYKSSTSSTLLWVCVVNFSISNETWQEEVWKIQFFGVRSRFWSLMRNSGGLTCLTKLVVVSSRPLQIWQQLRSGISNYLWRIFFHFSIDLFQLWIHYWPAVNDRLRGVVRRSSIFRIDIFSKVVHFIDLNQNTHKWVETISKNDRLQYFLTFWCERKSTFLILCSLIFFRNLKIFLNPCLRLYCFVFQW